MSESRYAKFAVYAGAFSGPLAGNSVLAIVPLLEVEFGISVAEVLLSISFYMFPFAIFSFFSGSISDIYGRRKVVTFGFLVYAIGALLCASSNDVMTFYISRGVQGFGYAFVNPVLVAILAEVTPSDSRGRNMGFLAAATTGGVAFGPLMAGAFSEWDWRIVFIVIALLCLICNYAILKTYKGASFVASGVSIGSMMGNVPRALKNKGVLLISAIGFVTFFCYIGALSFVSDVLARPPIDASGRLIGILIALTGGAGIFAAPFGGSLSDRIGRSRTAALGLLILLATTILMANSTTIWMFAMALVLLGTGAQILWASLFALVVELVSEIKGTVSSVFNSSRFMGYAISPLVLGPVYLSSGFDMVLTFTSIALIIGIGLTVILERS
ncbi:MAG: MFS transporter [Methanomassiliicoccales archaeon]|nr:MAG: MFS transporter [Methanomassiliicoccales archaeon]